MSYLQVLQNLKRAVTKRLEIIQIIFFIQTTITIFLLGCSQWHPTPVLLPGKSHGQRSLVGCSPWCLKELDTTERHHFFHKKRAISLLSQEGATSFLCMGRCKSLGSFKTFFDMHLNYLGPFFLHPESPQGAPLGAVAAADGLMDLTSFVH